MTPEQTPLLIGAEGSRTLADAGVTVVTGTRAEVVTSRLIELAICRSTATGACTAPHTCTPRGTPRNRVKQGGLACQQADAAAEAIAVQAGAEIEPQPYTGLLQGVLLTRHTVTLLGREPAEPTIGSDRTLWWPPTKIAANQLALHVGPQTTAVSRRLRVSIASSSSR